MGGWLRSGRFTLVIRGGAYPGTQEIGLVASEDGHACRLEPENLDVRGVVLRCEMSLDSPVVALHRSAEGDWTELQAERFVDRGYAQVLVPSFGEYRFEVR
jgi:hypothetical protein